MAILRKSGRWHSALGIAVVVCLSAVLWQCSKSTDPVYSPPRELTKAEANLVESDNSFGLKLFKSLSESDPGDNIFISPLSVAMALGMAYNGADGTTREAMGTTLELNGLSLEKVNSSYRSLIDLLTGLDPEVQFQIANSIWYRQGFEVLQEFINTNSEYFDAEVRELDFASADATNVINGWVKDKTNGKIESIVNSIPGNVVMYLINAIYFKGTWTSQFDLDDTVDAEFHREDGSTTPCRMMTMHTYVDALYNDLCYGVDLPYGNEQYSMTLLLPHSRSDVNSLIASLTPERWDEWMAGFTEEEMTVAVPRFKLEYEKTLNEILMDLGMEIAFTPGADFSKIHEGGGIWIDEVKHKTFIEVNEEGTEAAAVTSVRNVESLPPVIFFDRPFLYVIRENHSGTILFMGKMMDVPPGV